MNTIEVIGLGAGDIDQLPLGIYRKLKQQTSSVHVRTIDHPVISSLMEEGVQFTGYDAVYEDNNQFEDVYQQITTNLLKEAKETSLLYAVPGHPMLAEKTVQLLLEQKEVKVEISGGQSFLDDLFTALRIDPIEGFQFIDATSFKRNELEYRNHLIFCQVYDAFMASEVKLALLEDLPPDHMVTIVEAAGSSSEKLKTVELVELDHSSALSNLTSVYVPPVKEESLNHQFFRLREVIAALRAPGGCPWDQKQTHESLRKYLIEEAYEFIEAVNLQDDEAMEEEIGDVLLQVMLHSQIGEEEGFFTIDNVIKTLTDKMIRRHPHVFGDVSATTTEEVLVNWEEIKQKEKGQEVGSSILGGVTSGIPQLLVAEELQKKAAKAGFDWGEEKPVWDKIEEELEELREEIKAGSNEIEAEFGDILFAIVNLARYYKVNPEIAIQRSNEKFRRRFSYIEEQVKLEGKTFDQMSLEKLDNYWNEAKQKERQYDKGSDD